MHKNLYIPYIVLVLLGLSCGLFSPATPTAVSTDENSATGEPVVVTIQASVDIVSEPTQSASIIFADDFSSPTSGWTRTNEGGNVLSYSNGGYLTIAPQHERGWVNVGMSPTEFTDAVLSVDFLIASEDSSNTSAIIAWRAQDWKNYYALLLRDNGFVSVSRLENGQLIPIYDWSRESALITDHQVNHLDIVFVQETSTIYLNKSLITSFEDASYKVGEVGLGGFSAGGSSIEVRYYNVVVYDPNEWNPPVPR